MRGRRQFIGAGIGVAVAAALPRGPARAAEPAHDITFAQDFDELWETLRDHYCFFESKRTDWNRVRQWYRPHALAAESAEAFEVVVARVLSELYDAHTHLSDPPDGSRRWPLYDLLVAPAGEGARIVAIQPGSSAAEAGLRIDDAVLAVDGTPLPALLRDIAPQCLTAPDPAADEWSVNVAVAGRRGMARELVVRTGSAAPRAVPLPLKHWPERANVESLLLGKYGYIAVHTFADPAVVEAFDAALDTLRETRGLLLDVRGNGGGDTAVARPLMGRFIRATQPYARMRRREGATLGAPWTETVAPRGPFTYQQPVVVLTDHWSGSMAEGFPMGMRAVARATRVGTRMMGLGAAVFSLRLDRTGIQAQYSAEPVYDVQGQPRWTLQPDVPVKDGDDILAAGLAALKKLATRT